MNDVYHTQQHLIDNVFKDEYKVNIKKDLKVNLHAMDYACSVIFEELNDDYRITIKTSDDSSIPKENSEFSVLMDKTLDTYEIRISHVEDYYLKTKTIKNLTNKQSFKSAIIKDLVKIYEPAFEKNRQENRNNQIDSLLN